MTPEASRRKQHRPQPHPSGDNEHIILDDRCVARPRRSVGCDGQHDFALDAASGSTLVRLCCISKRVSAVDHDADGAVVVQSADLYKLRAAGADLHRRNFTPSLSASSCPSNPGGKTGNEAPPGLSVRKKRLVSIPRYRCLMVYTDATVPPRILRVLHTSRDLPPLLAELRDEG